MDADEEQASPELRRLAAYLRARQKDTTTTRETGPGAPSTPSTAASSSATPRATPRPMATTPATTGPTPPTPMEAEMGKGAQDELQTLRARILELEVARQLVEPPKSRKREGENG